MNTSISDAELAKMWEYLGTVLPDTEITIKASELCRLVAAVRQARKEKAA